MHNSLQKCNTAVITGIFFTIIVGSLCHFTYQWSNDNFLGGLLCATDESTFENLKLLLTPFILYTFIEKLCFRNNSRNYYISKAVGLIFGLILIPVLFYSYTYVAKTNYLIIDISIFIISVIVSYFVSDYIQQRHLLTKHEHLGLPILIILLLDFMLISLIKLAWLPYMHSFIIF